MERAFKRYCITTNHKPHEKVETRARISWNMSLSLINKKKEAERLKIEAEGKAEANRIFMLLTDKILKEKGIEATSNSKSPNSKVVVVGGSEGMPLILEITK